MKIIFSILMIILFAGLQNLQAQSYSLGIAVRGPVEPDTLSMGAAIPGPLDLSNRPDLYIIGPGIALPELLIQPRFSGPYFGQPSPGSVVRRFAPLMVPKYAWGISFSPDGLECFMTQNINSMNTLYTAKDTGGGWSDVAVADFSGTYMDMESVISPDGEKLYFGSLRPLAGCPPDILYQWYCEKNDSSWSDPKPMEPPLHGIFMMFPSVAANGNMYYSGWESSGRQWIGMSHFVNGQYQEPVELDDSVNSVPWPAHPFIAPDESYLIFDAVTDTTNWARDLYICFHKPDSSWSRPINMGTMFNNATYSMFPFVSRDGKYFFFGKDEYMMWVEADFIDKLRPRYGDYLGETPPDTVPKMFAKEFISSGSNQVYSCTFSPDGNEFYYSNLTSSGNNTWKTERINNIWTKPAIAPFPQSTWTIEPNFAPDGNTLYFVSDMFDPPPGPPYNPTLRIWSMEKTGLGWNLPTLLQGPFSDQHKMYPTVATNKNLYFTDVINDTGWICKSDWSYGGGYLEPVKLEGNINRFASHAHPFIAPDESYLIFDASPEGPPEWKTYLFISYRNNDGTWSEAQKLNDLINATGGEYCGYISPDQHYLFFARNNTVGGTELWWVNADHILHPTPSGEPYLGQTEPGIIPELFAPSIIIPNASQYGYFGITFSPDGKECFYGSYPDIMTTKEMNGVWPDPVVAPFSGTSGDMEASIAPDNARLFFTSDRTLSGAPPNISRLWYSDRTDTGWAAPLPIEQPLQDLTLLFPSVAQNRNLYLSMTDNVNQWISVSRYIDGSYQEPEKLSDSVNFNSYTGHSFIAPDESYIIFDALDHMSGNNPCRDLYISFRKADSSWSQARSLGDTINTYNGNEVCPFVTRDNRYLFFSRNGHFYWVKAPAFLPKVGIDERSPHDQRIEFMDLYPNPASHRVILEYFIPQKEKIRVMLTNSIGTSYLLFEREMNPGHHQLDLDLTNFTPGMWLCSLQSSSSVVSRKLILME